MVNDKKYRFLTVPSSRDPCHVSLVNISRVNLNNTAQRLEQCGKVHSTQLDRTVQYDFKFTSEWCIVWSSNKNVLSCYKKTHFISNNYLSSAKLGISNSVKFRTFTAGFILKISDLHSYKILCQNIRKTTRSSRKHETYRILYFIYASL